MKLLYKAALVAAALTASVPATAGTTISMTGGMVDNGSYGLPISFSGGGINLTVTGWQASQSTGAITTAYTGAYSPGTGVTGLGDSNGASGYHQIDNAGSYTDFILMVFSKAVTLDSLNLNSFLLGSNTVKDNDLAFAAINVPGGNLAGSNVSAFNWLTIAGNGSDGSRSTGSALASTQWLVAAAFNSGGNDGFKVASVTVTPSVPEPATWAMMLVGFGAMGISLRRKKTARRTAIA